MIGNAAIKAGFTMGLVAVISLPALAQSTMQATQQTIIEKNGQETKVETTKQIESAASGPMLMQTMHTEMPAGTVVAPTCVNRTLTFGATVAPAAIPVIPIMVPVQRSPRSYVPPNFDSSQDFIWEPFGPETDLAVPSFGAPAG